jgi:peptidoglycan hydrolase-like protein with peptidoglycan-binding domain
VLIVVIKHPVIGTGAGVQEEIMQPRRMRIVIGAFAFLSVAALVNLLALQPQGRLVGATGQKASAEALVFAAAAAPVPQPATTPSPSRMTPPAAVSLPAAGADIVRAMQRELSQRGYDTGSNDGVPGLVTRAAVLAYEWDHNLPLTAEPSGTLLQRVMAGTPSGPAGTSTPQPRTPEAEQVIRTVQQSLVRAGYTTARPDGRLGEDTLRAIHDFEVEQGLPETGRVSGQLVARLARLAGQGRLAGTP